MISSTATRVCVQILQADGVRGLYRGCITNLVRTTPAAAITFTSYEIISRNLACVAHAVDSDGGDGPPAVGAGAAAPGATAGAAGEGGECPGVGGPSQQEAAAAAAALIAGPAVSARAHA